MASCLARFDAFVPDMSFDDFVVAVASIPDEDADEHFRSQLSFITNAAGGIGVDFVGRYERLQADFSLVQQRIGLPPIELPRLQAARDAVRYVDYYSPAARRIVAAALHAQIDFFQYQFEGCVPQVV